MASLSRAGDMNDFILPDAPIPEGACQNCGKPDTEPGYELPLCVECRDRLVDRGLPLWVKGFFGLVILVFLGGIIALPGTLKAGIAYERGQRAYEAGQFAQAIPELKVAASRFPGSVKVRSYLALALHKAGKSAEAAAVLAGLEGEEIPRDLRSEFEALPGMTPEPAKGP
jgi:hypothetical protein